MSESAEALAANQTSRRNVTIEITNTTHDYCLLDPQVYLNSGICHSPPQPTVRAGNTEVCNFCKKSGASKGSVGVLTYDLFKIRSNGSAVRLAIMFSVPWDYNFYKNWVGVGLYGVDRACDEALYKEMYYNEEQVMFKRQEAHGSILIHSTDQLEVKVTMSSLGRAIMKVEVWDTKYCNKSQQQI